MKPKVKTWLRQIEIGNVKSNHTKVLSYVKRCIVPTNIYEMRIRLGISHQSLTATISELMDNGLIKSVGEIVLKGNTYSLFVFVSDENERKQLEFQRKQEKFKHWLEKGIDEYTQMLPMNISIDIQTIYFKLIQQF